MDAQHHGRRCVGGRNLLEHEQIAHGGERHPVVILRDQHAEEAKLPQSRNERPLEMGVPIPRRGVWGELRGREFAGQSLDVALLIGQREEFAKRHHHS